MQWRSTATLLKTHGNNEKSKRKRKLPLFSTKLLSSMNLIHFICYFLGMMGDLLGSLDKAFFLLAALDLVVFVMLIPARCVKSQFEWERTVDLIGRRIWSTYFPITYIADFDMFEAWRKINRSAPPSPSSKKNYRLFSYLWMCHLEAGIYKRLRYILLSHSSILCKSKVLVKKNEHTVNTFWQ